MNSNNTNNTTRAKRTKAANGDGSVYQRTDRPGWFADITVPQPDGTSKRKTLHAATRVECTRLKNEIVNDVNNGLIVPVGKKTFGAFLDSWLEDYAKESLRPGSYAT